MSLKNKLIDCLRELASAAYSDATQARASDSKAENALNLIYLASINQTTFTPEEQRILGPLLSEAIIPIRINIEGTVCDYRTTLDNGVLMKRSAIQFLIDDYAQFPVGTSKLATKLEEANIKESVELLDEVIDTYSNVSDTDEGPHDRESAGSKKVPASHKWWSMC